MALEEMKTSEESLPDGRLRCRQSYKRAWVTIARLALWRLRLGRVPLEVVQDDLDGILYKVRGFLSRLQMSTY